MRLSPFLNKIDRWLLLHKPEIWLTRVHVITFYALPFLLVLIFLALVLPTNIGRFLSYILLLISATSTMVWLQRKIIFSNQVPFKRQTYPYALPFFLSIIALNVGPIVLGTLCAKRRSLTILGKSDALTWSLFLFLSAVLAIISAVGVRGPYRTFTATSIVVLFQGGIYLVSWTSVFISLLTKISPILIGLYLFSVLSFLFNLPRRIKFVTIVLVFTMTPGIPLLLVGLYEMRSGGSMPPGFTVLLALFGVGLSLALAPLWERKLGQLSAQPV